tara:strand:+ start:568 stop:936 length:369 start_codon:yes stop_codon:yes gene_type:complete
MDDKKAMDKRQQYPNWLNYVFAVVFIAITVTAFVPDSGNWRWVPITGLMSYIFIRKSKEQKVWELGERLVMPAITFCFVVGFVEAVAGRGGTYDFWCYGVGALVGILISIYDIYIKPRIGKR